MEYRHISKHSQLLWQSFEANKEHDFDLKGFKRIRNKGIFSKTRQGTQQRFGVI